MDSPYAWLQRFIEQVPDLLQPLIVAAAAAIPYVEGEGAAALGIIAGIHPVVAAAAAVAGNMLCVLGVVALGSTLRERIVARRTGTRTAPGTVPAVAASQERSSDRSTTEQATPRTTTDTLLEKREDEADAGPTKSAKRRARLSRWLVRFGVPGASVLAPLALPTMLTAAFFVGAGIPKRRVVFWQSIAIVLWTSATAIATTGVVALLGW